MDHDHGGAYHYHAPYGPDAASIASRAYSYMTRNFTDQQQAHPTTSAFTSSVPELRPTYPQPQPQPQLQLQPQREPSPDLFVSDYNDDDDEADANAEADRLFAESTPQPQPHPPPQSQSQSQSQPQPNSQSQPIILDLPLMACPYWKLDPVRNRDCLTDDLETISLLKNHLKTKHTPKFFCSRCFSVFPDDETHTAHYHHGQCTRSRNAKFDGITRNKQTALNHKFKGSDSDQWFAIWAIVFPQHPKPQNPYLDPDLPADVCIDPNLSTDPDTGVVRSTDPDVDPSILHTGPPLTMDLPHFQEFAKAHLSSMLTKELQKCGFIPKSIQKDAIRASIDQTLTRIYQSFERVCTPPATSPLSISDGTPSIQHATPSMSQMTSESGSSSRSRPESNPSRNHPSSRPFNPIEDALQSQFESPESWAPAPPRQTGGDWHDYRQPNSVRAVEKSSASRLDFILN